MALPQLKSSRVSTFFRSFTAFVELCEAVYGRLAHVCMMSGKDLANSHLRPRQSNRYRSQFKYQAFETLGCPAHAVSTIYERPRPTASPVQCLSRACEVKSEPSQTILHAHLESRNICVDIYIMCICNNKLKREASLDTGALRNPVRFSLSQKTA